jgi:segregation and condensation protein A
MSSEDQPDLLLQASAEMADVDERNAFLLDLEGFEGPLHLLLDLARRQKVDLVHISILDLANQYLAFIQDVREKRVDIAADYLLMAAWLAYLKSKLLLPHEKKADDEVGGPEMAQRLAFRLARLEGMRRAVEDLRAGSIDGKEVFRRGDPEQSKIVKQTEWLASLHDLLSAFGDINVRKIKRRAHVVKRQPVLGLDLARRRLGQMIPQLTEWTAVQSMRAEPGDAPDAPRRSETASFFSAALELTKEEKVDLRQDRAFADVLVRKKGAGAPEAGGAS